MDATLESKLSRLKHYATRYELVASRGNGADRYLIAYTSRNNRRGLWAAVTEPTRAAKLVKLTGSPEITFAKRAGDGATMGEWRIAFSGRTQRECYLEGELPYVGDID